MSNSIFSPSVLTIPASGTSGTGAGELNVVTNPNATTDLTGWSATGLVAARQATGSPLDPVIPTGFQLTASATSQTFSTVSLTVPAALRNRKLKLEFAMTMATAAFKVDVLNSSSTRFNLTTDSSGVTNLPALSSSGKFVTYFDMDSGSTISIVFTSILSSGTLSFTDVIVGPGIQPQGAVVGEWVSYTGAITDSTGANIKSASPTQDSGRYRRVGSSMEIEYTYRHSTTAGSAGSGTYRFNLPSGFTFNASAIPDGTPNLGTVVGNGQANTAGGTTDRQSTFVYIPGGATNYFSLVATGGTQFGLDSTGFSFATAYREVSYLASVPINEWAGSGTVQLAQNDVVYYYGIGGTWGTGGTLTTGMGPGGVLGGTTTPASSNFAYTFAPTYPIQNGSTVTLETSVDQKNWSPITGNWAGGGALGPFTYLNGTAFVGAGAYINSNGINVVFGKYIDAASTPWSSAGTWYWRVKVAAPGAAVGFGIVQPGVASGLVSASGVPGNTTGNAIASGYVGEVKTTTGTSTTISASYNQIASLSITPGVWCISAGIYFSGASGTTVGIAVSTTANSTAGTTLGISSFAFAVNATAGTGAATIPAFFINPSSTTTYYLNFNSNGASSGTFSAGFQAVRIA